MAAHDDKKPNLNKSVNKCDWKECAYKPPTVAVYLHILRDVIVELVDSAQHKGKVEMSECKGDKPGERGLTNLGSVGDDVSDHEPCVYQCQDSECYYKCFDKLAHRDRVRNTSGFY